MEVCNPNPNRTVASPHRVPASVTGQIALQRGLAPTTPSPRLLGATQRSFSIPSPLPSTPHPSTMSLSLAHCIAPFSASGIPLSSFPNPHPQPTTLFLNVLKFVSWGCTLLTCTPLTCRGEKFLPSYAIFFALKNAKKIMSCHAQSNAR